MKYGGFSGRLRGENPIRGFSPETALLFLPLSCVFLSLRGLDFAHCGERAWALPLHPGRALPLHPAAF